MENIELKRLEDWLTWKNSFLNVLWIHNMILWIILGVITYICFPENYVAGILGVIVGGPSWILFKFWKNQK